MSLKQLKQSIRRQREQQKAPWNIAGRQQYNQQLSTNSWIRCFGNNHEGNRKTGGYTITALFTSRKWAAIQLKQGV